jgi:dynein intermediate chain
MNNDAKSTKEKLEELRKRKAEREKPGPTPHVITPHPVPPTLKDIVQQVLNDPTVPGQMSPEKGHNSHSGNASKSMDPHRKKDLRIDSFVGEITIQGKEKVDQYHQEIQVNLDPPPEFNTPGRPRTKTKPQQSEDRDTSELPRNVQVDRRISKLDPNLMNDVRNAQSAKKDIPQDEVKNIVKSKDFVDFLSISSKMVEKTLNAREFDLLEDILKKDQRVDNTAKKNILDPLVAFYDSQNSANRVVTSLEWAPNPDTPDLLLAAYSQNFESNPNDSQGVVLLWSLSLRSRPEFYCYCQSVVTSAKFNPFSSTMVVGGLYSGQIVLWDIRTKTVPVMRSGMSSGGHAHPIYSLAVVGTQNSHNIVSVSNDGRLCVWNTANLSSPQLTVNLKCQSKQQQNQSAPVNATCITFPEEEANNFYVGCEDGSLYSAQVHANKNTNDNVIDTFEGHQGPVTSVSCAPVNKDISSDISGLLLSSSFDWSVKLWNPKTKNDYIASFESAEDYVYDVAWNPSNPSVFSSVDGEGYIDIWDLSKDVEVPIYHEKADTNAINKAKWNKDGSKLATGNAAGSIKIHSMSKSLLKPGQDSLDKFDTAIVSLLKKEKKD